MSQVCSLSKPATDRGQMVDVIWRVICTNMQYTVFLMSAYSFAVSCNRFRFFSLKHNESWKSGDFRLTKKVYKVGSKQRDANQLNDVRCLVMSWLPLHFSPFCCSAQLWLGCLDQTTALISLQMCSQMALTLTCQCVIYLELAEFRPDVLGSSAAQNEPSQQPHFWWVWCCIKKPVKLVTV